MIYGHCVTILSVAIQKRQWCNSFKKAHPAEFKLVLQALPGRTPGIPCNFSFLVGRLPIVVVKSSIGFHEHLAYCTAPLLLAPALSVLIRIGYPDFGQFPEDGRAAIDPKHTDCYMNVRRHTINKDTFSSLPRIAVPASNIYCAQHICELFWCVISRYSSWCDLGCHLTMFLSVA